MVNGWSPISLLVCLINEISFVGYVLWVLAGGRESMTTNLLVLMSVKYDRSLCLSLQDGIDVLVACDGIAATLSGAEVAMLTNAWSEKLASTPANDEAVSE